MEAGTEKEEWKYSTMATGELFVMITGIWKMLALSVANLDFMTLLALRNLHTLAPVEVLSGWTMWIVMAVKIQLKGVGTEDGV